VTANEIRSLELPDPHGSLSETKEHMEFAILREIAAQLAELNAKPNPMEKLMEGFIQQFGPILKSMTPSPPPPAGTIIQAGDQYGVVQSDGSVLGIDEETALKLIAEQKDRKPQ
jgi:hypothetical protein